MIKNTPKHSGKQTDSSEYHVFPLYGRFTTSVFSENNSTVRMVGKIKKKKTALTLEIFLTSYFLVRFARKWK